MLTVSGRSALPSALGARQHSSGVEHFNDCNQIPSLPPCQLGQFRKHNKWWVRFGEQRRVNSGERQGGVYRLVRFTALGEVYFILTNRFDLTTHEIILLYAYRWQIELFFRCIKRTFQAIHLWAHEPNGLQIQYYLYLIVYLLLLSLKQQCPPQAPILCPNMATDEPTHTRIQDHSSPSRTPPACGIVTLSPLRKAPQDLWPRRGDW